MKKPPRIDAEVRHLSNVKLTAWRMAKRDNSPTHWVKYRRLRNRLKTMVNNKYARFIENKSNLIL